MALSQSFPATNTCVKKTPADLGENSYNRGIFETFQATAHATNTRVKKTITEEYLKLFKLFPRCGQGEVVEPEALVVGEGRPWLDY